VSADEAMLRSVSDSKVSVEDDVDSMLVRSRGLERMPRVRTDPEESERRMDSLSSPALLGGGLEDDAMSWDEDGWVECATELREEEEERSSGGGASFGRLPRVLKPMVMAGGMMLRLRWRGGESEGRRGEDREKRW
jgi:hypothetical protein